MTLTISSNFSSASCPTELLHAARRSSEIFYATCTYSTDPVFLLLIANSTTLVYLMRCPQIYRINGIIFHRIQFHDYCCRLRMGDRHAWILQANGLYQTSPLSLRKVDWRFLEDGRSIQFGPLRREGVVDPCTIPLHCIIMADGCTLYRTFALQANT